MCVLLCSIWMYNICGWLGNPGNPRTKWKFIFFAQKKSSLNKRWVFQHRMFDYRRVYIIYYIYILYIYCLKPCQSCKYFTLWKTCSFNRTIYKCVFGGRVGLIWMINHRQWQKPHKREYVADPPGMNIHLGLIQPQLKWRFRKSWGPRKSSKSLDHVCIPTNGNLGIPDVQKPNKDAGQLPSRVAPQYQKVPKSM